MYALNLNEENRILSGCIVLPNGDYTAYEVVDRLPDESDLPAGVVVDNLDVTDFLCKDGRYIYSPLPKPEPAPTITEAERLEALEMAIAELAGVIYNG